MPEMIGPNDVVIGEQRWALDHKHVLSIRSALAQTGVNPVVFEFSGPQLGEAAAVNLLLNAGYDLESPRQISDAKDLAENPPMIGAREAQTKDTELSDLMADTRKQRELIYDQEREIADLKEGKGPSANKPDDYGPGESPAEKHQVALDELDAAQRTIARMRDEVANLRRERGLA